MFSPTFVDIGILLEQLVSFRVVFILEHSCNCTSRGKTILKGTGDNYKREREANKDSHHE
jgi:molybdopterin-containing oxidoreductase family membrane subunit